MLISACMNLWIYGWRISEIERVKRYQRPKKVKGIGFVWNICRSFSKNVLKFQVSMRIDKEMFLKVIASDKIELIKYKHKNFSEKRIICSLILKKFSVFVATVNTIQYSTQI